MDTNLVADIARQIFNQTPREPSFWWLVLMGLACAAGAYGGAYFRTKGTNLAMKQGIGEITRIKEEVRNEFQTFREQTTQRHQLRLAALDKRLAVHQEAYIQWRELLRNSHSIDKVSNVSACEDWWWKNCLYLSPEVSKVFLTALAAAYHHPYILQDRNCGPKERQQLVEESWQRITKAGDVIRDAVELPSIGIAKAELKPEQEA